jgi:hypothetical protein
MSYVQLQVYETKWVKFIQCFFLCVSSVKLSKHDQLRRFWATATICYVDTPCLYSSKEITSSNYNIIVDAKKKTQQLC